MPYLAMTAAEIRNCIDPPAHIAWMACHFSPYGTSLNNLPSSLPEGSILILNDRTPVCGHDARTVAKTLDDLASQFKCTGILLDLQRPYNDETDIIVERVLSLGRTVCVSEAYADKRSCPVFLSPVPLLRSTEEYLKPWQDREVWLEIALTAAIATVTDTGCHLFPAEKENAPWADKELHLHYGLSMKEDLAEFTLRRTEEDLQELIAEAKTLGIHKFVGLWQELRGMQKPPCQNAGRS